MDRPCVYTCARVAAEIEARDSERGIGGPVAHPPLAFLVFLRFLARGHQVQLPWPAEGQVKGAEVRGVAGARVPGAALSDVENLVPRCGDHAAAVFQVPLNFLACSGRL